MSGPIEVDIPHALGVAGAKARMDAGIGKLAEFVPGGHIAERRWDGDTFVVAVEAFGQRVSARMEVLEHRVHAIFELPLMLQPFAEKLRAKFEKDGAGLLR